MIATQTKARHPARYSQDILKAIAQIVMENNCQFVLDPFAGTGRIFELIEMVKPEIDLEVQAIELEPEWAAYDKRIQVGNALRLPYYSNTFDAVITSPTYGNRMADHHNAQDDSRRNTYRHALGRELNLNNSGAMQWGPAYRYFHHTAWLEARRVLVPGGILIINCKDHIRNGEQVQVCNWHRRTLVEIGMTLDGKIIRVPTRGLPHGANAQRRVESEEIFVARKP